MLTFQLFNLIFLTIIISLSDVTCQLYNHNRSSYECDRTFVRNDFEIITDKDEITNGIISSIILLMHKNKNNSMNHYCTGTILTKSHILTTADCVERFTIDYSLNDLFIVKNNYYSSTFKQVNIKIDEILIHPNWAHDHHHELYNIAIIRLLTPFESIENETNHKQNSLRILSKLSKRMLKSSLKNKDMFAIQWNSNKEYMNNTIAINIQYINVSQIDSNDRVCNELIRDHEQQFCVRFEQNFLNLCNYQRGDPIFQRIKNNWLPVGVLSSVRQQSDGIHIGVYTKVSYHYKWIDSVLNVKNSFTFTKTRATDLIDNLSVVYECNPYKVSCGCSVEDVEISTMRIIGGEEAIAFSWTMTVSIRLNDSREHSCAGTILTGFYILTSASCVDGSTAYDISIIAGMHHLVEDFSMLRYVQDVYIHPDWDRNDNSYRNDIAILSIFPPLPVNGNGNYAKTCVPAAESPDEIINYPSAENPLVVVGWGSTHATNKTMSDTLQQVTVYAMNNSDPVCRGNIHDVEKQFCVKRNERGPCQGDMGGPVFQWKGFYWEQVGIVSYDGKCDRKDSPIIFTRLAAYFRWMEYVINSSLTTTTEKPPPKPISYACNKTSTCGCGEANVALSNTRIVGGENAIENSWPMIVSLRLNGTDFHSCGGSIVSKSYVLTAAHCFRQVSVEKPTGITIAAGMTNRSDTSQMIFNVDRIYIHPNYSNIPNDFRHDIALLHINESFPFESNFKLKKTCIHQTDSLTLFDQIPKNGTPLAVIGWGTMIYGLVYLPVILQQTQLYAIDNNDSTCVNALNNTDYQFCAGLPQGGKDSCQGDSGGPVLQWTGQYWEQVGIVSNGKGCGLMDSPGVNTRLSYYYDWIQNILSHDGEQLEPSNLHETTTLENVHPTTSNDFTSKKNRTQYNNSKTDDEDGGKTNEIYIQTK